VAARPPRVTAPITPFTGSPHQPQITITHVVASRGWFVARAGAGPSQASDGAAPRASRLGDPLRGHQ
jgi:hypothetical protein